MDKEIVSSKDGLILENINYYVSNRRKSPCFLRKFLLKFVKNILSLSVSVARNKYFMILSSRAEEKTNSKKMAKTETAVQIEKDIEDLSSMEKFDQFINLVNYFHLYRCKIEKCNNCYFLCNLWYMFKI